MTTKRVIYIVVNKSRVDVDNPGLVAAQAAHAIVGLVQFEHLKVREGEAQPHIVCLEADDDQHLVQVFERCKQWGILAILWAEPDNNFMPTALASQITFGKMRRAFAGLRSLKGRKALS